MDNTNSITDNPLSNQPISNQPIDNTLSNQPISNQPIDNTLSDQPISNQPIDNTLSDQPINNTEERNDVLNNNQNNNEKQSEEEETIQEKTIFKFNVSTWGIISAVANFLSVVFQLYKTVKTQKVKSFSMKFIALMTFLNLVYVVLGILTENHGMTFACMVFVVYNLIIVYYFYYGKS